MSFPGSSYGKESAFNAGDLGSIPGLGRSPEKGNGKSTPVFHGWRSLGWATAWGGLQPGVTKSWIQLSN